MLRAVVGILACLLLQGQAFAATLGPAPRPVAVAILLKGRSPYSPTAQQYFARLASQSPYWKKSADAALIDCEVSGGVWPHLDAQYGFAASDLDTAETNMVSASYKLTVAGTGPVLKSFVGLQGTSANRFLGPNLSSFGGLAARNSTTLAVASETVNNNLGETLVQNSAGVALYPKVISDTNLYATLNGVEKTLVGGPPDQSGLYAMVRTASTGYVVDRNGTQIASFTDTSAAPGNSVLQFARSDLIQSIAVVGEGLTAGQRTSLASCVQTWRTAVGLNKIIVADGDSITATVMSWLNTYPNVMSPRARIINFAVSATGMSAFTANRTIVDRQVPVAPTSVKMIYTLLPGANDLGGGSYTASSFADAVATQMQGRKTAGYTTVLLTTLPRGFNPGFNTVRNAYNAIVNAPGWAAAHGVDYICDVGNSPIMGPDAAAQDGLLYDQTDGLYVHPTELGMGYIRDFCKATFDGIN